MMVPDSLLNGLQSSGLLGQLRFEPEMPLSDLEFERFSRALRPYRFERETNGQIIIMSPTSTQAARLSNLINRALSNWSELSQLGYSYGPDAGFTLPDLSVRAADAAWVSHGRWNALSDEDKNGFARICPDFVVEVRSPSDSIKAQQQKMAIWLRNGVRLAWLFDPISESIWIYRAGLPEESLSSYDIELSGEVVLPGFKLDVRSLRATEQ